MATPQGSGRTVPGTGMDVRPSPLGVPVTVCLKLVGLLWLDGRPLPPDTAPAPLALIKEGEGYQGEDRAGRGSRGRVAPGGSQPHPTERGRCPQGPGSPTPHCAASPAGSQMGLSAGPSAPGPWGSGHRWPRGPRTRWLWACRRGERGSPAQPVLGGPCGSCAHWPGVHPQSRWDSSPQTYNAE